MTAPVITRTTSLNTRSFTVNWKIINPSHKYIVTWTNLLTGIKSNMTVAENTSSYTVTGLSGIDNYNVTVTANNLCGMMMSDPTTVYGKIVNMSMHELIKNYMIVVTIICMTHCGIKPHGVLWHWLFLLWHS